MKRLAYPALLLILLGLSQCNQPVPKTEPINKKEDVDKYVSKLIRKQLEKTDSTTRKVIARDSLVALLQISKLYELFNFKPVWTFDGSLTPIGDSLFYLLKQADINGLVPENYHVGKIDSLFKNASDSSKRIDAVKIADAELLLTDGLFKFAVHLNKGRVNPDSLWPEWNIKRVKTNLVQFLSNVIKEKKLRLITDSLEPKNEQYQKLKSALAYFRNEFKNSDWDSLPPIQNDTVTFYKLLRQRLIASHFYDSTLVVSDDKKLEKALKKFQLQHALNDDGKIGKATYAALCLSKEQEIRQIEMNMERWRWKTSPAKRYAWVNIPSYKLKVIDDDTLYLEAKVITGSITHHTPLLQSSITYFIIYPYWNVPYKIASEEILPRIKWDTAYLHKNNFDVLDWNNKVVDPKTIKWSKYNKTNLPYKFRQQEGGDNSLGVIKFMFNNPFGVYLHDTNSKKLFGKEIRALSHGCVRMENPWALADYLIKDDKHYTTDSLFTYFEKEQKKTIPLHKPLSLYINYFTAEVDEDGKLFFYTDIYELDKKMVRNIYNR